MFFVRISKTRMDRNACFCQLNHHTMHAFYCQYNPCLSKQKDTSTALQYHIKTSPSIIDKFYSTGCFSRSILSTACTPIVLTSTVLRSATVLLSLRRAYIHTYMYIHNVWCVGMELAQLTQSQVPKDSKIDYFTHYFHPHPPMNLHCTSSAYSIILHYEGGKRLPALWLFLPPIIEN